MAKKKKNRFDDGFQAYLTEKANFVGEVKMPEIVNMDNVDIPKELIPFEKIELTKNKRGYIHFYEHDKSTNPGEGAVVEWGKNIN